MSARLPETYQTFSFPRIEPGEVDWQRYYAVQGGQMAYYTNDQLWNLQSIFGSDYVPADFQAAPASDFSAFGGGVGWLNTAIQTAGQVIGQALKPEQTPTYHPQLTGQVPATMQVQAMAACPKGYHIAKKGPGKCVRNRHMNPFNPHALARSTRRITGFLHGVHGIQKRLRHAFQPLGVTHGKRSSSARGSSRGCYTCGRSARSCTCG